MQARIGARASSRPTCFDQLNKVEIASGSLHIYAFETGAWPPDGAGSWPQEFADYLPPPDRWNKPTPIGGTWSWTLNSGEATAALRITGYTVSDKQLLALDRAIDDGNPSSGELVSGGHSLFYILEK